MSKSISLSIAITTNMSSGYFTSTFFKNLSSMQEERLSFEYLPRTFSPQLGKCVNFFDSPGKCLAYE